MAKSKPQWSLFGLEYLNIFTIPVLQAHDWWAVAGKCLWLCHGQTNPNEIKNDNYLTNNTQTWVSSEPFSSLIFGEEHGTIHKRTQSCQAAMTHFDKKANKIIDIKQFLAVQLLLSPSEVKCTSQSILTSSQNRLRSTAVNMSFGHASLRTHGNTNRPDTCKPSALLIKNDVLRKYISTTSAYLSTNEANGWTTSDVPIIISKLQLRKSCQKQSQDDWRQ